MSKYIKPAISIIIALALGWLAICNASVDIFWDSIMNADWMLCLIAVPLYILCLYVRSYRWGYILKPLVKIGNYPLFAYSLVGMLVNDVVPARAGEFYRAYLCSKRHKVKYSSSLAVILVDRILDCIILVAFLGFVILTNKFDSILMNDILFFSSFLFIAALICVIFTAFFPDTVQGWSRLIISFLPDGLAGKLGEISDQFIEGIRVLGSLRRISWSLVLSILGWLLEAVFYLVMMFALGFDATLSWALLAIPVISFVLLVATVPANMGAYHFAFVSALALFGVEQSQALAAAVIVHSVELVVEIGLGTFYMAKFNLELPTDIKDIDPR